MKKKDNERIEVKTFASHYRQEVERYVSEAQEREKMSVNNVKIKSNSSFITVMIRFIVGCIALFFIFKAMSCTTPKSKTPCNYTVTDYPCTDTLVYIPLTVFEEMSLGDALVLLPNTYVQVVTTFGNEKILGYILKEDVKFLCDRHNKYVSYMDTYKVYSYQKVKPLLDRYKKWAHLNHEREKISHQEFEALKKDYEKEFKNLAR